MNKTVAKTPFDPAAAEDPPLYTPPTERIALIGLGAMGRRVISSLRSGPYANIAIAGLDPHADMASVNYELDSDVFRDTKSLLAWQPTVVVECAGHDAVECVVTECLRNGVDAIVASLGAMSYPAVREKLHDAQIAGKSKLTLVSGAIGGLDAISAARAAGLESVRYIGRKPPKAWIGSPAESEFDLSSISEPTTIFEGTAAESAARYPKNANVTAAVALAGVGFDATTVTLLADPRVNKNVHEVEAIGAFGSLHIRLENNPLPDNPRTSWLAALSIEDAILRRLRNDI
ncbi:aspartate dehydrogenase [Ralstonia sp. VS2407]